MESFAWVLIQTALPSGQQNQLETSLKNPVLKESCLRTIILISTGSIGHCRSLVLFPFKRIVQWITEIRFFFCLAGLSWKEHQLWRHSERWYSELYHRERRISEPYTHRYSLQKIAGNVRSTWCAVHARHDEDVLGLRRTGYCLHAARQNQVQSQRGPSDPLTASVVQVASWQSRCETLGCNC